MYLHRRELPIDILMASSRTAAKQTAVYASQDTRFLTQSASKMLNLCAKKPSKSKATCRIIKNKARLSWLGSLAKRDNEIYLYRVLTYHTLQSLRRTATTSLPIVDRSKPSDISFDTSGRIFVSRSVSYCCLSNSN